MEITKHTGLAIMALMVLLMAPIVPSSAQDTTCFSNITQGCNATVGSVAERDGPCCRNLNSEAHFHRECFCNRMLNTQYSETSQYRSIFASCSDFLDVYCPDASRGSSSYAYSHGLPSNKNKNTILIVCVVIAGLVVLFIILCFIREKIVKVKKVPVRPNAPVKPNAAVESQQGLTPTGPNRHDGANKVGFVTPESLQFKLVDLQTATNNFSKHNQIGRGGFGIVYKGTLSNGQQIAVKRLSNGSGQGDKEFQTEIVLLAKLQHKNLVQLLGFCVVDDEALLVYELVMNKSLDYFLFDNKKRAELNWLCRFDIIKGVARGMMYLHEDSPTKTMHRDLKAANVLLDGEMCPKIADFGLARICDNGQTHINPTRIVGTHGYMAPEYLLHGQFSPKSDVYALGVLILEIVSGTRVGGSSFNQPQIEGLLSYAWRCWEDEKPFEILDPMLRNSSTPSDEVLICVQMGLLCVQENSNLRPTMSTIVHMFNSQSAGVTLSMPQHPAFIYSGTSHETTTTSSAGDTVTLPQWSGRNSARRFR